MSRYQLVVCHNHTSYGSEYFRQSAIHSYAKRLYSAGPSFYRSQEIPVAPVLTFVLYYGKDRWNYPTNLKEEIDVPEIFDELVNDYKIKVFEISWLSPEQVSMFKSDFKVVANFFVKKRIDPDYIPDDPTEIKHVDAVLKLISVMSGDKRYIEIPRKEKVKNMCEVADRLENRGIEKGLIIGEEKATYRHISEGYLPAEVGAKELGISLEQLFENMEKAGYKIKK